MKRLILAGLLMAATPFALAESTDGFYTLGYTYAGIKDSGTTLNVSLASGSLGWTPVRWLGVEATGFWGISSANLNGYDVKIESGYLFSALPTLPLNDDRSVYARVGYSHARVSVSDIGAGSDHGTAYGAGIQWSPRSSELHLGARLEYTQFYDKDGLTIDGVTLSFLQRF
jgi:opacity protein-like surface antigen